MQPDHQELSLENRSSEIQKAHVLLDDVAARWQLSQKATTDLHVALEEHLTNVVNYGYTNAQPGRITVRFLRVPGRLRVEIEDDARPFNPTEAPEVNVSMPIDERPIGGLGIHMIRKFTDELRYERRAGLNLLVMVKHLPDLPP